MKDELNWNDHCNAEMQSYNCRKEMKIDGESERWGSNKAERRRKTLTKQIHLIHLITHTRITHSDFLEIFAEGLKF